MSKCLAYSGYKFIADIINMYGKYPWQNNQMLTFKFATTLPTRQRLKRLHYIYRKFVNFWLISETPKSCVQRQVYCRLHIFRSYGWLWNFLFFLCDGGPCCEHLCRFLFNKVKEEVLETHKIFNFMVVFAGSTYQIDDGHLLRWHYPYLPN